MPGVGDVKGRQIRQLTVEDGQPTFRPSKYNFTFQDGEEGKLLFNGLKGSLLRLPFSFQKLADAFLVHDGIKRREISKTAQPFFDEMVKGGFLVSDEISEKDILTKRYRQGRKNRSLHLLIAPTLECNLACIYCYQNRSKGKMKQRTSEGIVSFVKKKLLNGGISEVFVDWYGGEPLLAKDVIRKLTTGIRKEAKEAGCNYAASIVTNGTLLNPETVDTLGECGVMACQVTVDGPKAVHDVRRGYRRGCGSSFDRVYANLKSSAGKININLRINVDHKTVQYAYDLLELLSKEVFPRSGEKTVLPYIALTGPINPKKSFQCGSMAMDAFCRESLEFKKAVATLLGEHAKSLLDYPFPLDIVCGALRKLSFAFDPWGTYYRCGLDIAEEGKSCGTIFDNRAHGREQQWQHYNPMELTECSQCKFFPFCLGGCPRVRMDDNHFYKKEACIYWKENLGEIIRTYVNMVKK